MISRALAVLFSVVLLAACATQEDAGADAGRAVGGDGTAATQATGRDAGARDVTSTAVGAPRPGSQADLEARIGDRVLFGFDRYDLTDEARQTVRGWADWMKQYDTVAVTIAGHTDERGTREYNLALGERRAQAVKDYLLALGVENRRVSTMSYGKERPAVLGSTDEAWAQNRRSVVNVN